MNAGDRIPAGILPDQVDRAAIASLAARYTLGVPAIDHQHQILFGWYVALRNTADPLTVLRALATYAETHFRDEEHWAKSHGVDVHEHHEQHTQLLVRLWSIAVPSTISRTQMMAMAYDWLTTHIDVEDRELVAQAVGKRQGPAA